jgi:hypothetical protein
MAVETSHPATRFLVDMFAASTAAPVYGTLRSRQVTTAIGDRYIVAIHRLASDDAGLPVFACGEVDNSSAGEWAAATEPHKFLPAISQIGDAHLGSEWARVMRRGHASGMGSLTLAVLQPR